MTTTLTQSPNPALDEWAWATEQAKAPRLRTLREFAEQEIVIPTGPYKGLHFRCDRQPFTRLWFDEIDSGRWSRYWATGPSQASKTLVGFNIPLLYHLFEMRETVICGLPDMDMASEKWGDDIMPAIEACPSYKDYLPRTGVGSRGGQSTSIRFRNGANLKFMSAGGSDKSRAGKTARVLIITEADGFDVASSTSREADKITQLEARLRAWSDQAVEYGECTLSIEEGRTWQEITKGSWSRIMLPCSHCGAWVIPEREDVHGWEDAQDEIGAAEDSRFCCPECQKPWTEEQRADANGACRLVHRGQEIDPDGAIHGDLPRTRTLGFRWSAVHNLLRTAGDVGIDLWRAARAVDEENAERELCQFVFARPYVPPDIEHTPLDAETLQRRVRTYRRGMIPEKAMHLTIGVDLGKRLGHYAVIAWLPGASGHVADYGRFDIPSDDVGVGRATLVALREFRDQVLKGWPVLTGGIKLPDCVWIDAGWAEQTDAVYAFCRESPGELFRPLIGRGAGQQFRQRYDRPKKTGALVRRIGEGYHISWQRTTRILLVEVNVDYWKSWVHERLASDAGSAGAMTLFEAPAREHTTFVKHLTAERQVQEFDPKRGLITRWESIRRSNHWLDAVVYASAAGHFVGVRLLSDREAGRESPKVVTDWFARQKRRT
jgi:phage terminase large subunit GpA-like protein